MRLSGRIASAIEVLSDFETRRVPLKVALADWARGARYAGAKDRAWISGLCLDALRRRRSLAARTGVENPRAAILGALAFAWGTPIEEIAAAVAEEPHGPGALSDAERTALAAPAPEGLSPSLAGDVPAWLEPHMVRAFAADAAAEGAALAERADVDLRLNTLKTAPEKALDALTSIGAEAIPILTTAARVPAPDARQRAPAVDVIPAFNKGWVEVQDLGSQIAAAAAGDISGAQVLDFCAGGGGKTLALAALMANKGQLYAWDSDPHRLKPVYERAKRAGVRNLQIRNPAGGENLNDLVGRMDVVFVDAPCTGSGTWRRHPDTKWRLTPEQLAQRMGEQDRVLDEAAAFVKPGGRLVYVTCSVLLEENEDRLEAFLTGRPAFSRIPALDEVLRSGIATPAARPALQSCVTPLADLRLSPRRLRADGFFISVLQNAA